MKTLSASKQQFNIINSIKWSLLLIIINVFSFNLSAQGLSEKETLKFINEHANGKFEASLKRGRELVVDFSKNGDVYRTDVVFIMTLDAEKTSYSEEEKALIIRCNSDLGREWKKFKKGCFERTFHHKGKVAPYSRMNLKVKDDPKEIEMMINAFNHLIRLVQDEGDYMGVDSFE